MDGDSDLDEDVEIRTYESLTRPFTVDGHTYPVTAIVERDGTRYRSHPRFDDCPAVALVPRQANVLLYMFDAIYRVFSPLYLPGLAALVLVGAYLRVDDWLRFG